MIRNHTQQPDEGQPGRRLHWNIPCSSGSRRSLRARVAELERWRRAQEEAWSAFADGKRAIAASRGPRWGIGPRLQLAVAVPGGEEPLSVPAAMWLWLRVHVLYWRDGWPIISTRERRNNEVTRALCTAAQFGELVGRVHAGGPAGDEPA